MSAAAKVETVGRKHMEPENRLVNLVYYLIAVAAMLIMIKIVQENSVSKYERVQINEKI